VAQVKIYGLREQLEPVKARMSNAIHACVVEALKLPQDKRAHRFFHLERGDFYYPASASEKYTIIEISMFEGRSVDTKKRLIRLLFQRVCAEADRLPHDLEITISETPKHHWGIRGQPADELQLPYRVEV
jgi:phenylpyruvate tautomerase PptA (4-oxalocrotonate tautomerase family)